jgi:hypothetical protein
LRQANDVLLSANPWEQKYLKKGGLQDGGKSTHHLFPGCVHILRLTLCLAPPVGSLQRLQDVIRFCKRTGVHHFCDGSAQAKAHVHVSIVHPDSTRTLVQNEQHDGTTCWWLCNNCNQVQTSAVALHVCHSTRSVKGRCHHLPA